MASPTLAQGLNLSASVLLVPSIWRNRDTIPASEFANVAGRAGRAFVDLEGLVLHVVWEELQAQENQAVQNWDTLVAEAKAPLVQSGILRLSLNIYGRIAKLAGVPVEELVEYVAGNSRAWDFSERANEVLGLSSQDWDRDLASLDAAILALLDASTDDADVVDNLDSALAGSLFARQVETYEEAAQRLIRGFVSARAAWVWENTTAPQRKGYHAAGIGFSAGQFLDANLPMLVELLRKAESAIEASEVDEAATALLSFAELVFLTAPFRAPKPLPSQWKEALVAWIHGVPSAEVLRICEDDGVDLLQEALTYRLPWAIEAVRVHATAVAFEGAASITGLAALAVEAGSCDKRVIVILRAGLNSRETAIQAVQTTGAVFDNHTGMLKWLASNEVQTLNSDDAWPTLQGRHAWLRFVADESRGARRSWSRETQSLRVKWLGSAPVVGEHVIIEPSEGGGLVLTPSYTPLGTLMEPTKRSRVDVVRAVVGDQPDTLVVEYYGPRLDGRAHGA